MVIQLSPGQGIMFRAVPEDCLATIKIGPDGQPYYFWSNALALPVSTQVELAQRGVNFFYPSPPSIDIRGPNWVVNLCNEPDQSRTAMIALDRAFGEIIPIFNHPKAIQMSRRDISAKNLADIPNLYVPKTIRFEPKNPSSFEQAFVEYGFKYPVLVRPEGSQQGNGLVRINNPDDWIEVLHSAWRGRPHYMTQFVDFSDENGIFKKIRIAVVGNRAFLRAYGVSENWQIGHPQASGALGTLEERCKRLGEQHDLFPGWTAAQDVARAIADRVKLDFFGIDLGVIDKSTFVLFEANAAMSIADKSTLPSEMESLIGRVYDNIIDALSTHILSPNDWVYDGC